MDKENISGWLVCICIVGFIGGWSLFGYAQEDGRPFGLLQATGIALGGLRARGHNR